HWIRSRERSAVMEVQEQHQAARKPKPATVPIRRTTAQIERTPYWLGMPPYLPPRGSTRYDTGYVPYFPRALYGTSGTMTGGTTTGGTTTGTPGVGGASAGGVRY